ncbi:MAG: hypothetical protein HYX47_14535 [Burkholderiales bacterium]|nr:hypothetical protein [Burkholderiales bacterium]
MKEIPTSPQPGIGKNVIKTVNSASAKNGQGSSSALDEMKRRSAEHPGAPMPDLPTGGESQSSDRAGS